MCGHLRACSSAWVAPCGVCFLHYTKGGDRNPVMFFSEGCGHTVCKECFLKMRDIALRERKDITCPYCRKVVKRAAFDIKALLDSAEPRTTKAWLASGTARVAGS